MLRQPHPLWKALLGQAGSLLSAELASVPRAPQRDLDPALSVFEKGSPYPKALLHYGKLSAAQSRKPSDRRPPAIPAVGQSYKRHVQQASHPTHKGTEDRQVMIRLSATHPARDPDPQAIYEWMQALIPDSTWITDP
ncbi:hypothetical protein PAAG_11608 [Paracoccidioides lutzii Pb01]|uniref:Uncharacterized protein n=1 Tax=Paracoccidioides lutzii (strain ATCC MYA-826 / Pb01) TaxID=502779 RepID=A0A0A2V1G3_PARBA|nr:hypothetical protein PAAG_11608 [Paracoccidioides lutzii Pb01]KGQ01626.1 hypothetical protein PAAG_11608 [Paracoccidioides lutzii Pb01]